MTQLEIYISVDVETSGPIPGIFSLLSIGACLVHNPEAALYLELKPDSREHDPESLRVTGFDLSQLEQDGLTPQEAMLRFKEWVDSFIVPGKKIIFVGLNAPFDWSFINYYFVKYIGNNPFGFTAIDMKAYFMGARRCKWSETKSSHMVSLLAPKSQPTHNALDDARFQAELFNLMLIKENLHSG
jgi:DNA polymerase III epsilon subunit-like protein